MIQQEHLQVYDLVLTTRSPLFIGNGKSYQKMEYCFHAAEQKVSFLNENAFFQLMVELDLVDKYEHFILSRGQNLDYFLRQECKLTNNQFQQIIRYTISAADALDENHSLKRIDSFMRSPLGQAYLPGSSVKGALRTVLLTEMILKDGPKEDWSQQPKQIEGAYLNTLRCRLERDGRIKDDAVNSLLRGVQLSDSQPIPDSRMILTRKQDVSVEGNAKKLPLCRECVKPGTEISLKLTLDQSVLKGRVTAKTLLQSIRTFDDFYRKTYVEKFDRPTSDSGEGYQNCLILGGGAGFFSKTLVYPYLKEEEALKFVSGKLSNSFRKHNHERDMDLGISPRMLKYTHFRGTMYPYGICGVTIQ